MTVTGLKPADADRVQALMPGVENAVKFLGIVPEYKVLVGCNWNTSPALIEAATTCIRDIGAQLTVLVTDPPGRDAPTPRVVMEAAKSVDYYIQVGLGPGPHSRDFYTLLFDHGVSAGFLTLDEEDLLAEIGTYPVEVWAEIYNRLKWQICDQVDPDKVVDFHLTDDEGSDLRWSVRFPGDVGAWVGAEPLIAGSWAGRRPQVLHRGGNVAYIFTMGDLQYTATGKLLVDATNYFGETPEPIELLFENGRCVGVGEGELAQQVWDEVIAPNRNSDRVREIAISIHPKTNRKMPKYDPDVPVPVAPLPRFTLGDFTIALGGDTGVGGVDPGSADVLSLFIVRKGTTITADGQTILDKGRLPILDDPEIREFAAQYGDPDYLLSPPK